MTLSARTLRMKDRSSMPMSRLRSVYPNIMMLTTSRLTRDDSGERNFSLHNKISSLDMVETFMKEFRQPGNDGRRTKIYKRHY